MATMNNEWGFYQIPHTGVEEPDLDATTRTDAFTTIRRALDMKMCNFGALNVGNKMADDYTRTELTFSTKDDLADWKLAAADDGAGGLVGLRGTNVDNNPYIVGSTVKRVRDDQFARMGMDTVKGADVGTPSFDVMDTNLANADDMEATKNYPTEGWRSFGGKYDYLPYTGVFK